MTQLYYKLTRASYTAAIMAQTGFTAGAVLTCANYTSSGYSDWYLPSKNELNKLYLNKAKIGGFDPARYWSSSEGLYEIRSAWLQDFSNGSQSSDYMYYSEKKVDNYVRAVRAF